MIKNKEPHKPQKATCHGAQKFKKFEKHRLTHVERMCQSCSGYEEKIDPCEPHEIINELADMDKHEVLCSISEKLGSNPENFNLAEEIFEKVKYSMTEYVLKHEFNREGSLSVDVAIWLENRRSPHGLQSLNNLIHQYLKPK